MLDQSRRRWANIKLTLVQCLMSHVLAMGRRAVEACVRSRYWPRKCDILRDPGQIIHVRHLSHGSMCGGLCSRLIPVSVDLTVMRESRAGEKGGSAGVPARGAFTAVSTDWLTCAAMCRPRYPPPPTPVWCAESPAGGTICPVNTTQYWWNAGPASATLDQHYTSSGWIHRGGDLVIRGCFPPSPPPPPYPLPTPRPPPLTTHPHPPCDNTTPLSAPDKLIRHAVLQIIAITTPPVAQ